MHSPSNDGSPSVESSGKAVRKMFLTAPTVSACLYRLRCALEAVEHLEGLDHEYEWGPVRRQIVARYLDYLEISSRIYDQERDLGGQPSEKT